MSLSVAEPVGWPATATAAECVNCGRRITRRLADPAARWRHENGAVTCGTGSPAPAAEEGVERHPYAGHPAAAVVADHIAAIGVRAPTSRAVCECGQWRGAVCDYPAHLTEMLDQAGLLKETAT